MRLLTRRRCVGGAVLHHFHSCLQHKTSSPTPDEPPGSKRCSEVVCPPTLVGDRCLLRSGRREERRACTWNDQNAVGMPGRTPSG